MLRARAFHLCDPPKAISRKPLIHGKKMSKSKGRYSATQETETMCSICIKNFDPQRQKPVLDCGDSSCLKVCRLSPRPFLLPSSVMMRDKEGCGIRKHFVWFEDFDRGPLGLGLTFSMVSPTMDASIADMPTLSERPWPADSCTMRVWDWDWWSAARGRAGPRDVVCLCRRACCCWMYRGWRRCI